MASYDDTATVSGSVVGFNNGADSVPLKNWLVTLPASLDGYTEVNGTKIESNNLLGFGSVDFTLKGVRFYTVDGVLYLDGNTVGETSSADTAFKDNLTFYLPAGTYYLNRGLLAIPTYIYDYDDFVSGHALRINNGTFTLAEGKNLVLGFYLYNKSFTDSKVDACVNVGSTATAYEAYEAPTTYTASLGRTIYGGTADIVMGEGEATYKGFNLGALTWSGGIIGGQMWCWYVDLSAEGLKLPANSAIFDGICDNYTPIRYNGISSNANTIALRNNGYLYVNNGSDTIQPTGKVTIALDTADAFTFTPITPTPETELGSNTFWSDQGNTELTYYKDGYGFTSVTIHKETPDGEPIEETRKLHRIIYEGQVDVINGTGLIYRGESGTQYDPPEQISFTPIEVSTDEGENTLYADQGDSAITYRKAVD